jgi:thioredoxin 1
MNTPALTSATFDAAINQNTVPVLVDFWAAWCGPCKMIAPILDEIAESHEGRAVIAKVDVDAQPELAARFGITSIPTLVLFKDGKAVQTITGVRGKRFLEAVLAA